MIAYVPDNPILYEHLTGIQYLNFIADIFELTYKEREKAIKEYIIKHLHHNVTIFDVKGGFLEKKRKVLLSVIPSREYYKVTEGIKAIDKEAFFVVTDSYEVIGGK